MRITFGPGAARPLPSVTLTPATALRAGQSVLVTGRGFAPNTQVWVSECPPNADCGYSAFGVVAHADAEGTISQLLTLRRRFTVPANLPGAVHAQTLDCTTGCTITVTTQSSSYAAYASTPFSLAPG